jgi:hypothetical protein
LGHAAATGFRTLLISATLAYLHHDANVAQDSPLVKTFVISRALQVAIMRPGILTSNRTFLRTKII